MGYSKSNVKIYIYIRDQIFNYINNEKNDNKFELTFSIVKIYKENLYDLLNINSKSQDIKIKGDPRQGICVNNIMTASIEDKNKFFGWRKLKKIVIWQRLN